MNFFLFHQFFFSYLCIPDAEKRLLFIDLEYHRLMKKILFFLLPLCLVFIPNDTFAQTVEADSVDVLHYDLTLDMGHSVDKQLRATADITFRLTRDCRSVTFDLICDSLSPISLDGVVTRGYTYDRDNALLSVYISGGQAGDTHVVSVPYVSNGYVESYGFGGLHMDNNIYYNLGAAFSAYPHVYGRSWYPCRDNFYDKATYRYTVTAKPGWKALCSGIKQSEVSNPDGSSTSVWLLQYPIPTYISSVSAANWHVIERQYESIYGTYPAILGFTTHDSASVAATFDMLEEVIPMFERCFGPYRWERVGYISTPKGSMEHANNIGLVSQCMASTDNLCHMTICHELGHAWFGNLITCSNEGDMWINEGGATFCEEVATEAIFGKRAAVNYYQEKLSTVLRSAHIDDGGWRSPSGMSQYHTYGTTTYQQGAMVWHSLRGYLGDSLFYDCMNRLFRNCAFGNLDAAQLRDSLALYSGIDLTGFFDFHVYHPGFVDYSIDNLVVQGNQATLTLRQLLRGTDHYAFGNRVPITFFSSDLQQSDQLMIFDDSIASQSFSLPFQAAFAVVDYRHQLSDACTDNAISLSDKGLKTLGNSFCKIMVSDATNDTTAWVHVGHHYAHPTGDQQEGIVRLANRYWEVVGNVPWEGNVTGRFLYSMGTSGTPEASFIDLDFYDKPYTLDSLCLLYRANAQQPWQVVSRTRTASSTLSSGYFTARLFPGEYALAVIDTNLMDIHAPAQPLAESPLRLYPNPTSAGQFIVDLGQYDKKFDLLIYDAAGRKLLQKNGLRSGDLVSHHLPAGTYVVLIKNNFLSLQSQIIVQ